MSPPIIEVPEVEPTAEAPARDEPPADEQEVEEEIAELEEEPEPDDEPTVGILGALSSGATGGLGSLSGLGPGSGIGGIGVGPGPPHPGGVPKVRITKPMVGPSPSMDPAVIRRLIRQRLAEVRRCYEEALTRDPKLQGKLVLRFAIETDGSVVDAGVEQGVDATVDDCVKAVFESMSFPRPKGGRVVVSYPLVFRSNP